MNDKPNDIAMDSSDKRKFSILSLIASLFAGWFGVQTKANRERDFQQGKFHHFVIGGLVFAILFVLFIVGVVKLVMASAGV